MAASTKASGMEASAKNVTVQLASHGKGSGETKRCPAWIAGNAVVFKNAASEVGWGIRPAASDSFLKEHR